MALPGITDETVLAAQSGDADAMWTVVAAHDPILWQIIHQVAPGASKDDADDLLQEGRAELITRLRRYDSTTSAAQLQTYAYPYVRRAIVDARIRATVGLTIEPSAVIRVRKALVDYEGNQEAAFLAVQARHGMERTTFTAVVDSLRDAVRWDAPHGSDTREGGANQSFADVIPDTSTSFTDTAERASLAAHLLSVIAPRQSYALAAFHGVGMMQTPDEDVAAHLQTAKSRVRMLRHDGARSARSYADRCGIAA